MSAVRTLDRVPYLIIPVSTEWNDLEIPAGFFTNQPGPVTIEVTAGTFYFAKNNKPDDTTYCPPYASDGTTKLILTVGQKLWFKAASTSDRANISE